MRQRARTSHVHRAAWAGSSCRPPARPRPHAPFVSPCPLRPRPPPRACRAPAAGEKYAAFEDRAFQGPLARALYLYDVSLRCMSWHLWSLVSERAPTDVERTKRILVEGAVAHLRAPRFLERVPWEAAPSNAQSPTASRVPEVWWTPSPWRPSQGDTVRPDLLRLTPCTMTPLLLSRTKNNSERKTNSNISSRVARQL